MELNSQDLVQKANASVTRFTRTTESEHCHAVEHLWVRTLTISNAQRTLNCVY